MRRDETVQAFIDAAAAAVEAGAGSAGQRRGAGRIFAALAAPGRAVREPPVPPPADLAAHLEHALATARGGPAAAARLAARLADLAPRLRWGRRLPSPADPPGFADGHVNAVAVGEGGLEERSDARIGISLMAPHVVYPDHRHPPEELYVVLGPGAWRQADGPWHGPGAGGIVHNPPDVLHAMRAEAAPLLAVWCLWAGPAPNGPAATAR